MTLMVYTAVRCIIENTDNGIVVVIKYTIIEIVVSIVSSSVWYYYKNDYIMHTSIYIRIRNMF